MANTDLVLSLTNTNNGLSVTTPPPLWAFSSWKKLDEYIEKNIYVYGIQFQLTATPTVDNTSEYIIEIGTGAIGNESTKLQIPYSMRTDTAVGIFLTSTNSIFLPESYLILAGSTISIRIASSIASQTINGIKLQYTSTGKVGEVEVYPENYKRVQVANGMGTSMGGVI